MQDIFNLDYSLFEANILELLTKGYTHNYFDQSHMIREFRYFTNRTPGKFLQEEHQVLKMFLQPEIIR